MKVNVNNGRITDSEKTYKDLLLHINGRDKTTWWLSSFKECEIHPCVTLSMCVQWRTSWWHWTSCIIYRCVYNEGLAGDIELHASFIQRHDYRDSFVCYTNTILTKYKKYEVVRPRPTFKVWFTNMNGEKVDVQNFNLELMLEYWASPKNTLMKKFIFTFSKCLQF